MLSTRSKPVTADPLNDGAAIDRAFADISATEKAFFIGRMHLLVIRHRHRVIRMCRGPRETSHSLESVWVVLGALLGFLEGRAVTQKSLAASMAGAMSAPTLSRAIRDSVNQGWITTRVHPRDIRLRLIEVTQRSVHAFARESVINASWLHHTQPLRDLLEALLLDRPREARVFESWLHGLDQLPVADKTLILVRLHQKPIEQLVLLIMAHRTPGDFTRGAQSFWVILEAIMAHMDNQELSQKDLVAAADGLYSPATISRVVRQCAERGWIDVVRSERDSRVSQVLPSKRARDSIFVPDLISRGWAAYISIFTDQAEAGRR